MRRKLSFLLGQAVLTAAVVSCASTPQTVANAGAASLHDAAAAWTAAVDARDAEAMAAFFAPAVVVMYPQPAPARGREANREDWARFFRRPNATHPLTTDTLVLGASGDLAYTLGRWAVNYDGPKGPVAAGGRYLAVWRSVDGAWRIVALSRPTRTNPLRQLLPRPSSGTTGAHRCKYLKFRSQPVR